MDIKLDYDPNITIGYVDEIETKEGCSSQAVEGEERRENPCKQTEDKEERFCIDKTPKAICN